MAKPVQQNEANYRGKLTLIMQNKANFKKAEMFVSYYLQKDCENESRLRSPGKQSQSNPISTGS